MYKILLMKVVAKNHKTCTQTEQTGKEFIFLLLSKMTPPTPIAASKKHLSACRPRRSED